MRWLFSRCHVVNPQTFLKFLPPTVVQGGRGWWNPFPKFLICCSILKPFAFSGKPVISTRWAIFYGWWHCWRPVTSQKWLPSRSPSWILSSIRNQVKTSFHWQALLLLLKEVEKDIHIPSKMAWPPAAYDVILITIVAEHHNRNIKQ